MRHLGCWQSSEGFISGRPTAIEGYEKEIIARASEGLATWGVEFEPFTCLGADPAESSLWTGLSKVVTLISMSPLASTLASKYRAATEEASGFSWPRRCGSRRLAYSSEVDNRISDKGVLSLGWEHIPTDKIDVSCSI